MCGSRAVSGTSGHAVERHERPPDPEVAARRMAGTNGHASKRRERRPPEILKRAKANGCEWNRCRLRWAEGKPRVEA
jgi:hypothetical protein